MSYDKGVRRENAWLIGVGLISVGCASEPSKPVAVATPEVQPEISSPGSPESYLFAEDIPSCREWAMAANYYIKLGETRGIQSLFKDASKHNEVFGQYYRAAHLCRILFEPKGKNPLRMPYFGGLGLPYETMPLSRWPEFPMVTHNGSWFILAEGYTLRGHAEPFDQYVAYCRAEGRYRTKPINVPSVAESKAAVESLITSPRWKAIKWSHKDAGTSYEFDAEPIIKRLRSQADH
ncbi:MAG: hypothetical protein ABL962_21370 [Fimbriimonadaceae bacterium]